MQRAGRLLDVDDVRAGAARQLQRVHAVAGPKTGVE
jgi:hypothetical protein